MKKHLKVSLLWVLGALSILIGSMIGGRVEMGLGVSTSGFFVAVLIAFVLFLLGGLFWIVAAIGIRKPSEV